MGAGRAIEKRECGEKEGGMSFDKLRTFGHARTSHDVGVSFPFRTHRVKKTGLFEEAENADETEEIKEKEEIEEIDD
ncbi:MAG: hypothetical protein PHO20_00080 [Candidatus Peribacteraceae bacterium]|nr:hypothetical protein [Candidatus Peribacteraceae bacterium]MDD5739155.1 hypothetical protein [Candidatus Peribacteraceae bacterium]